MSELADRNCQEKYFKGHYGITGTFAQKIKEIAVSHNLCYTDGLIVVDSTAGEVVITLPPIANMKVVDEYRHIFPIMHVAGENNVKIQLSGNETFANGATFFNLGKGLFCFDIYVIRSANLSIYGLYGPLDVQAAFTFDGTFDTASFSTVAIAPLDTVKHNDQSEILLFQGLSNGVIASAATASDGAATLLTDVDHGLTTGEVITIAGTTSYNDEYSVTVIDDDTFTIPETFVADESGTWIRSARITVLVTGRYSIRYKLNIVSTGGTAWAGSGFIYKNGTKVEYSGSTTGGIASGTEVITSPRIDEDMVAGDYIDLRISNDSLTGALKTAILSIAIII